MSQIDISKLTSLWVWYLGDPAAPTKVGSVSLIPAGKRCSFVYDDSWHEAGFALSLDMPLGRKGAPSAEPPSTTSITREIGGLAPSGSRPAVTSTCPARPTHC